MKRLSNIDDWNSSLSCVVSSREERGSGRWKRESHLKAGLVVKRKKAHEVSRGTVWVAEWVIWVCSCLLHCFDTCVYGAFMKTERAIRNSEPFNYLMMAPLYISCEIYLFLLHIQSWWFLAFSALEFTPFMEPLFVFSEFLLCLVSACFYFSSCFLDGNL